MADIKQLKIKIQSTKNIKKITNAMEVISTIKLQKIKKYTETLRDYMNTFLGMLASIDSYASIFPQPSPTATRHLAILVSSEKWLCGSLNTLLFKQFDQAYADTQDLVDVYAIGKKAKEYCKRRGYTVIEVMHAPDMVQPTDVSELSSFLIAVQDKGIYKTITLRYNFFKNTMKQIPVGFQLSPLSAEKFEEFAVQMEIDRPDMVVDKKPYMALEPDPDTIVKKAYEIMMNIVVYGAILHNKTGEFAARMLAMKWAKDNATNVIGDLTLAYNKARQDAITKEVLEIVSAKAVLEE